jgi:CRISPR-associated exonuclease Cas4
MLNVSSISEYVYCPLKVYLRQTEGHDIQTPMMIRGRTVHEVRRGFEELLKRNLWSVNEKMNAKSIFETLMEDVPEFVDKTLLKYCENGHINPEDSTIISRDLKDDLEVESWLMAVKVWKIVSNSPKSGSDIADMFFPPVLLEFAIENNELNLRGKIDRIEIMDGYYYPVEVKSGLPPVKGVWMSDSLQIAAYALLMEEEFNREVSVGFIDYMGSCQRRPVFMEVNLREEVLNVLEEMRMMFHEGVVPEMVQNPKKCSKCEYSGICEYSAN